MTKQCFKCLKQKDINEFYKHPMMADGHVNKCKECNKSDVTINRGLRIEFYRKYDRARGARHESSHCKEYRDKFPNKYKAHGVVNNAIRSGKLHKEPCGQCSSVFAVHAHHDDYLKQLNVRWLCAACHSQWHRDNGQGLNP
jgi:hypothetical protein